MLSLRFQKMWQTAKWKWLMANASGSASVGQTLRELGIGGPTPNQVNGSPDG